MNIGDLFNKYGSDKNAGTGKEWKQGIAPLSHTYGPVYEELLGPRRESIRTFLEIGVLGGASLRAWREWLPESCAVYGLDINLTCHGIPGVTLLQGDSRDRAITDGLLDNLRFDVIIDDGGHHPDEQQATWDNLWCRVNPDGYWITEDLQWFESIPWFAERGAVIIDRNHLSGRWDDRLAVFHKGPE